MASSSNDYLSQRAKQIERKKKIVTYISLLSFGGSMLFGAFNTIKQGLETPQPQKQVESAETDLQKEMKGYELVLQREPNNQMALEKLSMYKIKSGDNKGAIPLLDRLVKLYPDRQDYKIVLENAKKQ